MPVLLLTKQHMIRRYYRAFSVRSLSLLDRLFIVDSHKKAHRCGGLFYESYILKNYFFASW
ncbi:hypothetical protein CLV24_114120 [Pontibacter ummariensis]|uniref:Uncharacterized protein n=1 Tax=Pontibacter ummariensis TaxID=1610492 RepID=A0A239HQV0_9BACT|nr:hypothetical protein CLV24_114120 [Pontibacter ummariensis]SNS83727.1 hypothetical protein SAMN06296052_114120 [Pontibacter ummariensis]